MTTPPDLRAGAAAAFGSPLRSASARLGEVLLERRLVEPELLESALRQHRRVGTPLGTVLLAREAITRRDLYSALADVWQSELVYVDPQDIDPALPPRFDPALLAEQGWVPLRVETGEDGRTTAVVAASGRPCDQVEEHVRAVLGVDAVRQFVTTDWDVHRALRVAWRNQLIESAVNSLRERSPELSASRVVTRPQVLVLLLLLAATVAGLLLWPSATVLVLVAALNVAFAGSVFAKLLIGLAGIASEDVPREPESAGERIPDEDLPMYTILVPAYKEASVVSTLMHNLATLDYPREKLEILLLLEEDDPETFEAALAAAPPEIVRVLVLPDSTPKTKPRACNIGLAFAQGELVVIFDAEDRPDPDQLRKAVAAFRDGGDDLVCVQAALNYFNADENLLTRMFTLEYSAWFDNTLPGLDRLGLPIPLGGTSNHFRVEPLRELGGWDPYNVTEDADLGIRSAARGGRVAVIRSTTFEEANVAVGNWIRQRSRWIKGYMQTCLVHTRNPVRLVRTIGVWKSLGFLLLIGGTPLSFLAGPPLWALFLVSLFFPSVLGGLPEWVQVVALVNLAVGNAAVVFFHLLAVFARGNYRLAPFALLAPLYWVLHSVASYKALWQLVSKPFYWEKTTHGLSTHVHATPAVAIPQQRVGEQ
ncbi:hypothetical protein CLV92_10912 [Kineococcus xinjiangensis]|uniref:Uncharacterized protein n=1 Tax=Kineococcus xinjiangensis TaxID=512762 RepID=A0A2S6IHS6_9ACTN|nr:glycosyltransferase [Kineococcus xinjiangensis]PPK93736.1 hypothetical protein CLV92_10912 [Kineococcus xinjiangensis]